MRQRNKNLQSCIKDNKVALNNSEIDDDDMQYISNHCNTNTCQQVCLNNNSIHDAGILNYSKRNWNSVIVLGIGDNLIGFRGCKYLIRAQLTLLQCLDIGRNQIQSLGMNYLSKSQWNLLEQIYLSNNNISDRGIINLIKSKWKRLNVLQMNWNAIDYSEMIKMLLLETYDIKIFDLRHNDIFDENKAIIMDLITKKFTYDKLKSYY